MPFWMIGIPKYGCNAFIQFFKNLTCIIHQEIWLWARRLENGGGNVPGYVEQNIFQTTQPTAKVRSVWEYLE